MSWWALLLLALGCFLLGLSPVLYIGLRARPMTRAIVVRTRSGRRFRGAWRKDRRSPWLILHNAELLQDREPAVPLDGFVCLPREGIEFFQVVEDHRPADALRTNPNRERRAV